MKSYLRFLFRNKLYTTIEVVGLSISLAFIILMSSYVIKNISYDREIKNKDEIYLCHNIGGATSFSFLSDEFPKYPEIQEYCQFGEIYFGLLLEGEIVETHALWVSDNFFEFLPYRLIAGDVEEMLKQDFSAVVSESFVERYFPGENPVGQTLEFNFNDKIWTLTVTGVFKDVKNTKILNADILVNQRLYPTLVGMGWFVCANLVKIDEDVDRAQLAHDIYYNSTYEFFALRLQPELKFTRYDKLDVNIGYTNPFQNISDLQQQKRFTTACVILLIFSLLNYIFLSFAFSRFRIKEMATKMILGTSGKRIIIRLITESLFLTSFSFALGVLGAVALEKHVSLLLSSEIDVFSNSAEFLWGSIVIIFCSVFAATVPAFGMAGIKPVEVLKGESRRKDKMILGRVFVAIQAGICIVIVSVSLAMYLQIRKITNEPLGYRTEGLIEVGDYYDDVDLYDILQTLPCVSKVTRYSGCPIIYSHARLSLGIRNCNTNIPAYVLKCDSEALSLLGIDILEKYGNDEDTYFTKGSYEAIESLYKSNGVDIERVKHDYAGVVSDFKFGNAVTILDGATCVSIKERRNGYLLVEVTGDVYEAKKMILETFIDAMEDRYYRSDDVIVLEDMVKKSFTSERNSCVILGAFSLLCILLIIMALVAMSSYYSLLHTHDVAIQKVLGISPWKIFSKTVWGFVYPALLGAAVGIPVAYMYIGHWLERYIIRINNSLVIYVTALVTVFVSTLVAVLLQAIHLMRTNPAEALKKE